MTLAQLLGLETPHQLATVRAQESRGLKHRQCRVLCDFQATYPERKTPLQKSSIMMSII